MALTSDEPRTYLETGGLLSLDVLSNTRIFQGAGVGESVSTGDVRGLVGGDTFHGFCDREADNRTAAEIPKNRVRVWGYGLIRVAVFSSATKAHLGNTVYMTDDTTFSLTSTGGSTIGKVAAIADNGDVIIFFQGAAFRSI